MSMPADPGSAPDSVPDPALVLRAFGGRVALRMARRGAAVCMTLAGLVVAAMLAALVLGEYPVGAGDLWRVLTGAEPGPLRMVVLEWRLPRAVMAALLGAALGASGAIFQSLSRNPLGSPDVIGLNAGAYTGALVAMIFLGGGALTVAGGAILGGVFAAVCVYLLAWRGGIQGFRLIVVGIGVGAMLTAFNTWLILNARLEVAMTATVWGAGSLNGIGLDRLRPTAFLICLGLFPALVLLARPLRQLETGDDLARASGVAVEPVRLARAAGTALLPAALTGALLLSLSDLVAAHALAPRQIPVGVVTLAVGGLYLLWLLGREAGRQ